MSEKKEKTVQQHQPKRSGLYTAARVLAAVLFHTIGPVRYTGRDNLPEDAPYIVIANHQSWMDPIIVGAPIRKQDVTFLGKKELVKSRLAHYVLTHMHMIIVDRHNADMEAMRACTKALRSGEILGIFPEGTRHHKGVMEELESGVGLIALRAGVPLVPMYIDRKYGFFRLTRCYVGAPIDYSDLRAEGVNKETCQRLMERITQTYAQMQTERKK